VSRDLTLTKALIFRIVHRENLDWILDHGLTSLSSGNLDPNFVSIGNPEIIARRHERPVSIPPGGTLADYVPFYFTPWSPMLYNIKTGWGGVTRRPNEEILILVSSIPHLVKQGRTFVFTDRHALLGSTRFSANVADLNWIDWGILQARDFKRSFDDLEKVERYQAEALVHQAMPVSCLLGVGCYSAAVKEQVDAALAARNLDIMVVAKSSWYF
jgi:ssDNA thymidine ADP-ribosyltransferase DarT-like protein